MKRIILSKQLLIVNIRKMVDLERILKIAQKNKGKSSDGKIALTPIDFIDLINSRGRVIFLNKESVADCYRHEAEYTGFIFKTFTERRLYDL